MNLNNVHDLFTVLNKDDGGGGGMSLRHSTYKICEDKFKLRILQFGHEIEGFRGATKFLDAQNFERRYSAIAIFNLLNVLA